jgi:hypothetical protein
MNDSDPLLRAVADGDPNCPDGRTLAALGDLFRRHAAPPGEANDLSADILARLSDIADADNGMDDQENIDAYYDGDDRSQVADPQLDRLSALARSIGPRRVDLTAAIQRRIRTPSRFATVFDKHANQENDQQEGLDGRGRWRIISAVIAGHVAALLAFAIFELGFHAGQDQHVDGIIVAKNDHDELRAGERDGSLIAGTTAGKRNGTLLNAPALPPNLPNSWSDIRGLGTDLFLLRRFPELRANARPLFGMQASTASVSRGVAWIRSQLNPVNGTFTVDGGNSERDLATHSLATLALLGEGLGDKALSADTRKALDWLRVQLGDTQLIGDDSGTDHALSSLSQVTSGLLCLSLVEGALLYGDTDLRAIAEASLVTLDRGLPMQPGAAGLGGFTLLALETAQQGGLRVPGRLLSQARRSLAIALPKQDADAGRVGLAAFAQYIYGLGSNSSTRQQITQLSTLLPATAAGRTDPLGWFFATLAMREADGADWQRWSSALEAQLIPLVQADGHVASNSIRYGETGGDVFATSLVMLNLQVPYRYLPLAPTGK